MIYEIDRIKRKFRKNFIQTSNSRMRLPRMPNSPSIMADVSAKKLKGHTLCSLCFLRDLCDLEKIGHNGHNVPIPIAIGTIGTQSSQRTCIEELQNVQESDTTEA